MGDLLGIREAAALVGRNPETVRRWVSSGRLPARRERNRLLVDRADVQAVAGKGGATIDLAGWVKEARRFQQRHRTSRGVARSAADLVIEDRAARSR